MTADELDAGTRLRVKESDIALIAMCREAGLSEGQKDIVFDAIKLRHNLLSSYLDAAAAVDRLIDSTKEQGDGA